MDDLSHLPVPDERHEARERLRRAFARANRKRRRGWFAARALVTGLAMLVAWAVVPDRPEGELVPLLGLADAVEHRGVSAPGAGRVWYSRTERMILHEVPPELLEGAGASELRFLLPSLEETWIRPGDVAYRRTTYGDVQFLAPGDRQVFMAADLGALYPVGRVVSTTTPGDATSDPFETVARAGKDALYQAIETQVAGLGDRRREEVEMLRLAADLMRRLGHDPGLRSTVLRAMADIPGLDVDIGSDTVEVSVDYVDGDRPLRLVYAFDADTAHLVSESLAVLATHSEPGTVLSRARYDPTRFVSEVAES